MSTQNIIRKLIGIQDVNIKEVKETEKNIEIYIALNVKPHICLYCGQITTKIHDYRTQQVTDIPYRFKVINLIYRKRRYTCKNCQKHFYENNSFLPRYQHMTNRLSTYIIEKLRNVDSFTNVAKEVGKSVSTIIRVFDMVSFKKPALPEVLSIDEFKENTNREKYQVILTDPINHTVLYILPARTNYALSVYFNQYKRSDRLMK